MASALSAAGTLRKSSSLTAQTRPLSRVSLASQTRPEEWAAAIRPETKLFFLETPSNPLTEVADIAALAEILDAPVVTTLMGLGLLPPGHPRLAGMIGMHGAPAANHLLTRCDMLVAVGARFDDRATGDAKRFCPGASVIHIDIDPSEHD